MLGCSLTKKPEFVKITKIALISVEADTIKIGANALFKNPNTIGGKIATDAIAVFVNDTEIAKVSSKEFKVPAKETFSVPLQVTIPAKTIFKNNKNGILGSLLNSLFSKKIKVKYKGDLRYKFFGFSHVYTINKTEEIKIKL